MPKPVCVLMGERNNPNDWREPMVIMRINAATKTNVHDVVTVTLAVLEEELIGAVEEGCFMMSLDGRNESTYSLGR